MRSTTIIALLLAIVVAGCGPAGDPGGPNPQFAGSSATAEKSLVASEAATASLVAPMYAVDFVSTAATGFSMNDAGSVVGRAYTDPGCGPFCLPPQENVAWRGGARIVLPPVPGALSGYDAPRFINNQEQIAGTAVTATGTHVALWSWNGTGFLAQDLGVLAGMTSASVAGMDEQGRIIGWASTGGAIPAAAAPFMWSQASAMVNLATQGYPNQMPAAISRGGSVVTTGSWYRLGDPASAQPLPPLPRSFVGAGSNGSAINDAGDQAHFLVSTSTQNLVYPFRLSHGGTWQQISTTGTGRLSRYAMGSINAAQDITFTALSTGAIAAGPDGLGQSLAALISPAYGGAAVVDAGPMNASGQILSKTMIGRSQRLVKLTPVTPCDANCLVSSSLVVTSQFVEDPRFPGSCFEGGKMYNSSAAEVKITDEAGAAVRGVVVSGRFLDDYWTDHRVSGTTDANGVVRWSTTGPCGVGAIAFLVDSATLDARQLDRTRGLLTSYVIPGTAPPPPPPTNQAPVPVGTVTCSSGRTCFFDGTASYDPDGSIAAYRWAPKKGQALSTAASFTYTFPTAGRSSIVLSVTDNLGLTASKTLNFKVLP